MELYSLFSLKDESYKCGLSDDDGSGGLPGLTQFYSLSFNSFLNFSFGNLCLHSSEMSPLDILDAHKCVCVCVKVRASLKENISSVKALRTVFVKGTYYNWL